MPIRWARSDFNGGRQRTISTNKQMRTAAEFRDIVIKSSAGNYVRLWWRVEDPVRSRSTQKLPAVLIRSPSRATPTSSILVTGAALLPELAMVARRRRDFDAGRPHRHHRASVKTCS
jgi:hypothetical protein